MQLSAVLLYLETALHVSGRTSTHHMERIQLYLQQVASGYYLFVFRTMIILSSYALKTKAGVKE